MKSTFYIKFRPSFERQRLVGIKPYAITQSRPHDPRGGYAVVKFVVDIDEAMFAIPEVAVTIAASDGEVVAEVLPPFDAADIIAKDMESKHA